MASKKSIHLSIIDMIGLSEYYNNNDNNELSISLNENSTQHLNLSELFGHPLFTLLININQKLTSSNKF